MADVESMDLPFRAEYAKSNRSVCKGCRMSIAKDKLRLAKMVQSPVFDGKVPNWFHFKCFFMRNRPTAEADIGGFASLRWDDQQQIKSAIGGKKEAAGPVKSADPDAGGDHSHAKLDLFQVGYASSGRSKCRRCGEKIENGEIRIAFMETSVEFYQPVPRWHHPDCFIDKEFLAEDIPEWPSDATASMITNYGKLKAEDKKMLDEKIGKEFPQAKAKGKGKGKSKGATGGPPPTKKAAPGMSKLEMDLKAQNDALWAIRDQLYRCVKNNGLKQILEENDQDVPPGESRLLDSVADGMLFGALKRCPECHDGQLVMRSTGLAYRCTGNLTSWTKCQYKSQDVQRSKSWVIPDDLKEEIDFLKNFKFKQYNKGKRVFPEVESASSSGSQEEEGDGKRKAAKKPGLPLRNCRIVLVGKMTRTGKTLKEAIGELGGVVVNNVTANTACVISTEADVEKMPKKIRNAKTLDVHVVSEDFLDAVKDGVAALKITEHTICTWGSDPSQRIDGTDVSKAPTKSIGQKQRDRDEKRFSAGLQKTTKLQLKGGAVVDEESDSAAPSIVNKIPFLTLMDFIPKVAVDEATCIRWLREHGLLHKSLQCGDCSHDCVLEKSSADEGDQEVWRCSNSECLQTHSIRSHSLFEGSQDSLVNIVLLLYLWAEIDLVSVNYLQREARLERSVVKSWLLSISDVLARYYSLYPQVLGGIGSQVEINVVAFKKLKPYDPKTRMILGGLDRQTKKAFGVEIQSSDAATLLPIIREHVRPGSTIFTDTSEAYASLPHMGYVHHTVDRSKNFVDPVSGAHINRITSFWTKLKHRYQDGDLDSNYMLPCYGDDQVEEDDDEETCDMFPSYLIEHIWRKDTKSKTIAGEVFAQFLYDVMEVYPVY